MFKEKLFKDALRMYAGQHVLDRVEQMGEEALKLGAGPQHATIMWTDIRMTPHFQAMSPKALWDALNAHQQMVVDSIERHDGIVDSLVGDGILAYWGTRGPGNHAALALNCAADILHAAEPSETRIAAQIGLDTGMVGLGNHGTSGRRKYTVMGDVVNLASRLNGRCYQYGVYVLLSEAVLSHAGTAARPTRLIDTLRVVGKEDPIDIYTLANVRKGWPEPEPI